MHSKLYFDTREEEEAHVSFLVSAAQYASNIPSRALKSHLSILSNETLRMKNFARGRRFKRNETCQYCLTNWRNGEFSLKVIPFPKKLKRMKKICRNIAKNKPLVKIEKKIAVARNIRNLLLVKCLVCTKQVKYKLRGSYTGMSAGGITTSVPTLSLKNVEKERSRKMRKEMTMKKKKYFKSNPGAVGFPSQKASEGNPNQMISPRVGCNFSQNGDGDEDEIKITYERRAPAKRKLDTVESDNGKATKKRKNQNTARTAGYRDIPSILSYNISGNVTYNTSFSAECPMPYNMQYSTPYNMQYNTPYGIPYGMEYNTPYNNSSYASPYNTPYNPSYNTSYNTSYNEMYADYGDYSAVGYNPLGTGADASKKKRKRKKKKKKGASNNQNSQNNQRDRDLILNPFSDKVKEIRDLPKKKLNRWKKLISEEEDKSSNSPSFKDFLDKLQRG